MPSRLIRVRTVLCLCLSFNLTRTLRLIVNTGYIRTQLVRPTHGFNDSDIAKLMGPAKMTLDQGAATTIAACVTPDAQGGTYWTREKAGKEKAEARNEGVQERLWEVTRDLVKWG